MKKRGMAIVLAAVVIGMSALTGSSVTAKAADEAGIRAFVTRMYEVCLDREPEETGLNDWSNRLATGQELGADTAFGFIFSQEFRNLNLCNEHYVDSMYAAFFDREGDAAGKADWLGQLNSGATRGHIMTGFVNSQEFANLCAAYGIDQGSGDWSADDIPVNGTCAICANGGNTGNHEVTPGMSALFDVLRHLHRVGMRGVHHCKKCTGSHEFFHLRFAHPPFPDHKMLLLTHHFPAVLGRHTRHTVNLSGTECLRQFSSLRCPGKNQYFCHILSISRPLIRAPSHAPWRLPRSDSRAL